MPANIRRACRPRADATTATLALLILAAPMGHARAQSFRVLSAWYQTPWFAVAVVLMIGAVSAAGSVILHRRRTRQATAVLASQFEATLAERARIARELHDTLLQGFTGIVLRLEALRHHLARSSPGADEELSRILVAADHALFEARQRVWDMRTAGSDGGHDVADALERVGRETLAGGSAHLAYTVAGSRGELRPGIDATVLLVGREAMRNAVHHGGASHIEVELNYAQDAVRLTVRDDGVGLEPGALPRASANGHFGVLGMRERAAAAGGRLDVASAPNAGTTVVLELPRQQPRQARR